jgi:hypothetical protein
MLILNLPSSLVNPPYGLFLMLMLTFASGLCVVESMTVPVRMIVCPIADGQRKRVRRNM